MELLLTQLFLSRSHFYSVVLAINPFDIVHMTRRIVGADEQTIQNLHFNSQQLKYNSTRIHILAVQPSIFL